MNVMEMRGDYGSSERDELKSAPERDSREQPRLYSFKQLLDISYRINKNSPMGDTVESNSKDLAEMHQTVEELRKVDVAMRQYIDSSIADFKREVLASQDDQNRINKKTDRRISTNLNTLENTIKEVDMNRS